MRRDGINLPPLPTCPVCGQPQFSTELGTLEHGVCRVLYDLEFTLGVRAGVVDVRSRVVDAHRHHLIVATRIHNEDRVRAADQLADVTAERDRARDLAALLEAETVKLARDINDRDALIDDLTADLDWLHEANS